MCEIKFFIAISHLGEGKNVKMQSYIPNFSHPSECDSDECTSGEQPVFLTFSTLDI
jgi:hypothetical protein